MCIPRKMHPYQHEQWLDSSLAVVPLLEAIDCIGTIDASSKVVPRTRPSTVDSTLSEPDISFNVGSRGANTRTHIHSFRYLIAHLQYLIDPVRKVLVFSFFILVATEEVLIGFHKSREGYGMPRKIWSLSRLQ